MDWERKMYKWDKWWNLWPCQIR